jgi:hypothetical protein
MLYDVKLVDGTTFVGKKNFWINFNYNGFLTTAYQIVESGYPALPVGSIIHVSLSTRVYSVERKGK